MFFLNFLFSCCKTWGKNNKNHTHSMISNPRSVTCQLYESFRVSCLSTLFFSFFFWNMETKIFIDYNMNWGMMVST